MEKINAQTAIISLVVIKLAMILWKKISMKKVLRLHSYHSSKNMIKTMAEADHIGSCFL